MDLNVKIKLSLCSIKHQAVKMYGSFLAPAIDVGEWWASIMVQTKYFAKLRRSNSAIYGKRSNSLKV
jgi:hypothetical protein